VNCPKCKSIQTANRKKKTKLGYATFFCEGCNLTFNERTGTLFNNLRVPTDVVFMVLLWRFRYKLSLRDLSEMFLQTGFTFTHETIRNWEERFGPLLAEKLKAYRKKNTAYSPKWLVDETYVQVEGEWCYLYRAVDRLGNLVDVRLSKTRDLAAAEAFFKKAMETGGKKPKVVTTDKHDSYPEAIRKTIGKKVKHRTSRYLNNFCEQSHRPLKERYYPYQHFRKFKNAERFIEGYEEQHHYFRLREYRNEKLTLKRKRTLHKLRFEEIKKDFLAA
jgi:putative transposase